MAECLEVKHGTALAWLEKVRRASSNIEPLVREIAALEDARDQMLPWRSGSGGHGGGAAHSDPTATEAERRMGDLDELIADRARRLDAMQGIVGDCGTMLGRMAECLGVIHAQAIELYYLDLADTWSEVAAEIGVSSRHLQRIRSDAYGWIEEHPMFLA